MCQGPEPEGQRWGHCIIEQLPYVPTVKKVPPEHNRFINEIDTSPADSAVDLKLNITHKGRCQLQQRDPFCKKKMDQLQASKLPPGNLYYIEGELLIRNTMDMKHCFLTVVLPG